MQATAQKEVVFTLSNTVVFAMGLDDDWYVKETYPTLRELGGKRFAASSVDAEEILFMLDERTGDGGFENTPAEIRSMRIAAKKLREVLSRAGA